MLFFDPHYQTVPGASAESPGRCFGVDELASVGWPLLDAFSQFVEEGKEFNGTIFRLSFRTSQQASTSEIKRDAYTVSDALDAVHELQEMGSAMLLFLKHVRRLRVEHWDRDGSVVTLLSMQATNPEEIAKSRLEVNDLLSSAETERILTDLSKRGSVYSSCRHEYKVTEKGAEHTETWHVVDGFFVDDNQNVVSACRKMIENEEKALPYAGVAWPLDPDRRPPGRIFCFLPVPMQTSMPTQINGYFDLDDSRQNMFLDQSAHGSDRLRVDWNKKLLKTSVAQAHVCLLEDLRSDIGTDRIDSYYDVFPTAVSNETSWEQWLTSAFYKHASEAALIRCSGDTPWCVLSATRSLPPELQSVGDVLIAEDFLPIPAPPLPQHVQKGFTDNRKEVPKLTPSDLRIQLKDQCDVDCPIGAAPRACLQKREYVVQIFRFCLSDSPEDGIRGLPLIIDCRGHLRTVGLTDTPLYLAGLEWDLDIFPDHPEWFVDPDLVRSLDLAAVEEANLLDMDSECFMRELAKYVFAQAEDGALKLSTAAVGPLTDAWLQAVFNRLLDSDLKALGSDLSKIPLIPDQSRTLLTMDSSATPLLFRGSQELKRALTDLSVPLVTGVSKELYILLQKFSEKEKCIWSATPRDLIDTLADQCSEAIQEYDLLTNVQQALLTHLSRDENLAELEKWTDRQNKLKSLKLFPTANGTLVDLNETAYVSQDFKFPHVDFDVVLLDDGPAHRWRNLYLLLGMPELSRSRLIHDVLLPGFGELDGPAQVKASAWLRDNLSGAQSENEDDESDGLFEEVRNAAIIICSDGEVRPPTSVYQPESKLASTVLGDKAAFPDMNVAYTHSPDRWLEFFRLLDMPIAPRLTDVVEYVQTLAEEASSEDKTSRFQAVYKFIKDRVDTEIQDQGDLSDELSAALEDLADIPWVPLRQEAGVFLCFAPPEEVYVRPGNVYFPRVGQLVASQACITVLRPEPDKRARRAMGFPVKTPIELVVSHFEEVLAASSTQETMPKESVLVRALGQIYRFFGGEVPREADELSLETGSQDSETAVDLKSKFFVIPCIWDQEMKRFWRPEHVFTDYVQYMEPWRRTIRISEDGIERGYTALGRKQEPSIEDWKQVLEEISESGKSPSENEVSGVIREIIHHIVEELGKADAVDGKVLVPTQSGRMLAAEAVFMADAPWYESMLDSWDIPILATSVSGIWGIQRMLEIPSLAASIEERLTKYPVESDMEDECRECDRLEGLLQSNEFILGLQRLLRHEGQEVSEESMSYLHGSQVQCVKVIQTCLFLKSDGTERLLGDDETGTYWDPDSLQAMLTENRRRYFCNDLAELLNRSLGDRSLNNLAPLVETLKCEPSEISQVLDDLKIRQYSFDQENRPEYEDEVTLQEFPDETDETIDEEETSETKETEVPIPDEGQQEEKSEIPKKEELPQDDDSEQIGQSGRSHEDSTATRDRRTGISQPGEGSQGGRPCSISGRRAPSGTETSGSDDGGRHPDMEKSEPPGRKDVSSQENTASSRQSKSQRRLVSYVSYGDHDDDRKKTSQGDSRHLRVGEAAVQIVIEHEKRKGRQARSMAHTNPGYDVISDCNGEEIRYIEVKGTEAAWGERGVALTPTQFLYAKRNPDRDYWLYVVEDVFSRIPRIHEIQNPSDKVDRFVFDGGWRQAAESAEGKEFEMPTPSHGDEVLEDGNVIGIVESTLESGRFPLVFYRDLAGNEQRKLLKDIMTRPKE